VPLCLLRLAIFLVAKTFFAIESNKPKLIKAITHLSTQQLVLLFNSLTIMHWKQNKKKRKPFFFFVSTERRSEIICSATIEHSPIRNRKCESHAKLFANHCWMLEQCNILCINTDQSSFATQAKCNFAGRNKNSSDGNQAVPGKNTFHLTKPNFPRTYWYARSNFRQTVRTKPNQQN